MAPVISVLLPCYHMQPYLVRALKSLQGQTFAAWEALVISDDGFDYRAWLDAQGVHDERFVHVSTGKNGSGVSNARNVGLMHSRAFFVSLLDPDDAYHPTFLETLLPWAERYGVSFANLDIVSHQNVSIPSPLLPREDSLIRCTEAWKIILSTNASILFDKRKIHQRWWDALPCWEDVFFTYRCFDFVDAIYFCAQPLYRYLLREGSLSAGAEGSARFMQVKKWLLQQYDTPNLPLQKAQVRAAFFHFLACSLDAEKKYSSALAHGETLDFSTLLRAQLETT